MQNFQDISDFRGHSELVTELYLAWHREGKINVHVPSMWPRLPSYIGAHLRSPLRSKSLETHTWMFRSVYCAVVTANTVTNRPEGSSHCYH